jgi:hypothetical protein
MDWFKLLPSYFVPGHPPDHLRDFFIILTAIIALFFVVGVLRQTYASLRRTKPYLDVFKASANSSDDILKSELPLILELRHHLVDFPARDGQGRFLKRRTVDADEIFRDTDLGPAYASSRFMLAIPSILTGLGVLGTFIGLALGLGSLEMSKGTEAIEGSIKILIPTFAAAFSSSVWGVGMSIICSGIEKFLEAWTLGRVRKIQCRIDDLFPRYVPEEAMLEIERNSRGAEDLLKGLAVQIGNQMQVAVREGVAETIKNEISEASRSITAAIKEAFGSHAEGIGKDSAGVVANALKDELNNITTAVRGLNDSVASITKSSEDNSITVQDAVKKLNSHESVMSEMAEATKNISASAQSLSAMSGSLEISATRNKEAADAQLAATQSNTVTAHKFDEITKRLPEMQDNLDKAADVISTIVGPLSELKIILENLKKEARESNDQQVKNIEQRDESLLKGTAQLVAEVKSAAIKFSEVGGLSESLVLATGNLNSAAIQLGQLGSTIKDASDIQGIASEASRQAAISGENAAKAFGEIPEAIANLASGLEKAGSSVCNGALAAQDSYKELKNYQEQWFAGVSHGLILMKEQLQSLINAYGKDSQEQFSAYGTEVEVQTRRLIEQWTGEVNKCLESYSIQVGELQGGLDSLQSVISKLQKTP